MRSPLCASCVSWAAPVTPALGSAIWTLKRVVHAQSKDDQKLSGTADGHLSSYVRDHRKQDGFRPRWALHVAPAETTPLLAQGG